MTGEYFFPLVGTFAFLAMIIGVVVGPLLNKGKSNVRRSDL